MRLIARLVLLSLLLTVLSSLSPLLAQPPSDGAADEAAIRQAIAAAGQAGAARLYTKDKIYWGGAGKMPVVGDEPAEEIPDAQRPSWRKPKTQQTKATVVRLEIADAGDMAYEFSNLEVSFETTDDKMHSVPVSVLRVWRKIDGEWKIAAHLARRHYQEPETAAAKD